MRLIEKEEPRKTPALKFNREAYVWET